MTGFASDVEATYSLLIEEYSHLRRLNPKHELLRFLFDVNTDGFKFGRDPDIHNQFLSKYAPNDEPIIKMWNNYLVDLITAVDQIEGTSRLPKKEEKRLEQRIETEAEIDF